VASVAAAPGRGRRWSALVRRAALERQVHEPLDERAIRHARVPRRVGEVLAVGDLRVRVRFEHVELAGAVEPEVDAGVARQLERPIHAPAEVLDLQLKGCQFHAAF